MSRTVLRETRGEIPLAYLPARGRLIGTPDRQLVTELIEEAVGSGCRRAAACATLDITLRTYQRWTREDGVGKVDGRKGSRRTAPANKLSGDERQQILAVANSPEFASSPPSQIVPTLVDRGEYLASESTIYRILKAEQQHHRVGQRNQAGGLPFDSVDKAREWTLQFVQWYNHQHKHSGLKFVTPAQRHDGRAAAILRHREQVYEAAKQRRPERWSGATRDWTLKDEVWLNPERNQPEALKQAA